jgi:sulfate-transporting ATPase
VDPLRNLFSGAGILAAEGDSHWTFFDGNYQEYEADKRKRLCE